MNDTTAPTGAPDTHQDIHYAVAAHLEAAGAILRTVLSGDAASEIPEPTLTITLHAVLRTIDEASAAHDEEWRAIAHATEPGPSERPEEPGQPSAMVVDPAATPSQVYDALTERLYKAEGVLADLIREDVDRCAPRVTVTRNSLWAVQGDVQDAFALAERLFESDFRELRRASA